MKRTIYYLLMLFLLAGVSCSKHSSGEPKQGEEVRFKSEILAFEKSKTSNKSILFDYPFTTGDEISVFALNSKQKGNFNSSGNYADNVRYVYRNGTFTAQSNPIRLPSGKDGLEYYAICPYSAEASNQMFFSVQNNQSTVDGYLQSDLLTAHTSMTTDATPYLDFYHSLCQLCINVKGVNGTKVKNSDFSFYIDAKTRVDVNIQADSYNTVGSHSEIDMLYDEETDRHYAIIPPQTYEADEIFLHFIYKGDVWDVYDDYSWTFSQGTQQQLNVEFEDNGDGTYRAILIDGQIKPWNAGN